MKLRKVSLLLVLTIFIIALFGIPFEFKNSYEEIFEDLKSDDDIARLSAIAELSNQGKENLPVLLNALDEKDEIALKVSIIQILGNINEEERVVSTLIRYLNNDNWRIQFFSAESLGKLNSSQAIQPLKKQINYNENKKVKLRCLLSLSEIDKFNDIEFLKNILNNDGRFEVYFKEEVKKIIKKIKEEGENK